MSFHKPREQMEVTRVSACDSDVLIVNFSDKGSRFGSMTTRPPRTLNDRHSQTAKFATAISDSAWHVVAEGEKHSLTAAAHTHIKASSTVQKSSMKRAFVHDLLQMTIRSACSLCANNMDSTRKYADHSDATSVNCASKKRR